MSESKEYNKLLFEHEVLLAKYEIRHHYLTKAVQEIYENIGQTLSLIRVQLSTLSTGKTISIENVTESSDLVGKVIQDIRNMSKYFNPESEYLEKFGIIKTIEDELTLLNGVNSVKNQIEVEGVLKPFESGTELIVLRMMQEIFLRIRNTGSDCAITLKIIFYPNSVALTINYIGKPIELDPDSNKNNITSKLPRLSLIERAKLMGGELITVSENNYHSFIQLTLPLN